MGFSKGKHALRDTAWIVDQILYLKIHPKWWQNLHYLYQPEILWQNLKLTYSIPSNTSNCSQLLFSVFLFALWWATQHRTCPSLKPTAVHLSPLLNSHNWKYVKKAQPNPYRYTMISNFLSSAFLSTIDANGYSTAWNNFTWILSPQRVSTNSRV